MAKINKINTVGSFGDRLVELRMSLRLSQLEFGKKYKIGSQVVISKLEKGLTKSLSIEQLENLKAACWDCKKNLAWLITGADIVSQDHVIEKKTLKIVERECLPERDWDKKFVPIVGRMGAGMGIDTVYAEQTPPGWVDEYVEYPDAPKGAIAVRVVGESMQPLYDSSDIVIIDTQKTVVRGLACCIIEDEFGCRVTRLKVLKIEKDEAVLQSLNPDFAEERIAAKKIITAFSVVDRLKIRG